MEDFIDDVIGYVIIGSMLVMTFFFGIDNVRRLGKILERKYDEKIEREKSRG